MKKGFLIGFLFVVNFFYAQSDLEQTEHQLNKLMMVMYTDTISSNRIVACDSFTELLHQSLKDKNSFQYPFSSLNAISFKYPKDSSFRVITYELNIDGHTYLHRGFIQKEKGTVYELTDRSDDIERPSKEIGSHKEWYGAYYYNILTVEYKKDVYYLLFGYDSYNLYDSRKIIDVLSFTGGGRPKFGKKVFFKETKSGDMISENRFIFQYASTARTRLNYDTEYKVIIFDNLIAAGSEAQNHIAYVPDGSYSAFEFKKGNWYFIDKLFNDFQEDAPRPSPILDKRKDKPAYQIPEKED